MSLVAGFDFDGLDFNGFEGDALHYLDDLTFLLLLLLGLLRGAWLGERNILVLVCCQCSGWLAG